MRTNLRRDLTAAIKTRDRVAVAALRSALAAIDNAEAVPADHSPGPAVGLGTTEVEPRSLAEADIRGIVEAEVHQRSVAATGYERVGRGDLGERLRAEADVLTRSLHAAR